MANSPISRVDPFPPSPSGRKTANNAVVDLDEYAPSFNNFTEDRNCMSMFEPDSWDPAVIGAKGAYIGTNSGRGMAPQSPGGKKSKDRASY